MSALIGFVACGSALTAGHAQIASTVTAEIAPVGAATAAGSALLTGVGDGTTVDVSVTGLTPGATYTSTIHGGTCDMPSASFSQLPALTADAGGAAAASGAVLFRGAESVAFLSLADNAHVIVIADDAGVVGCAEIPAPIAVGVPALPGGPPTGPTAAVPLDAVGSATATGTATLTPRGGGTEVVLALTGLVPGAAYTASMHAGTCALPSASFAALPALTADAAGAATATGAILFRGTDPVPAGSISDAEHVIVVAGDSGVVACGVIPSLVIAPAATGDAGLATNDAARTSVAYGALAFAAVMAVAFGARRLTARRTR